jgi:hypothetical protein
MSGSGLFNQINPAGQQSDYMLARASLTAAMKAVIPAGMLKAKMTAVGAVPQSGSPDVSSKIEPTAAIAVKQAIPRYAPLLGVTDFSPES